MEIGRIGLWTSRRLVGEQNLGEAAALAEELGFGALWLGGSPPLSSVRPMLAATSRLIVATGIVNVWQYEPETLAAEHAALTREFPGRLLLGIGIGHPEATSVYARPLTKMREFLDGLDRAAAPVPREERAIAALGPKMLDLAAERTLGTHPYFTTVDHTRFARERVGSETLLAPELACVLGSDPASARQTAREYARMYLGLQNYTENLRRFGFGDEDIEHGGSDRLIEAVIPSGSVTHVADRVREHLDAGADHVCVQTVGVEGIPREQWAALASELLG